MQQENSVSLHQNRSEMATSLLEPQWITVAHKPTKTLSGLISKFKEKLKTDDKKCYLQDQM